MYFITLKMQRVDNRPYTRVYTDGGTQAIFSTGATGGIYFHPNVLNRNVKCVEILVSRSIRTTCSVMAIGNGMAAIATNEDRLYVYKQNPTGHFDFVKYFAMMPVAALCIVDKYLLLDQTINGAVFCLEKNTTVATASFKGYLAHNSKQALFGKGTEKLSMVACDAVTTVLKVSQPLVSAAFTNSLIAVATETFLFTYNATSKTVLHRWLTSNVVDLAIVGHMLVAVRAVHVNVVARPTGTMFTELCDPAAPNVTGYDLTSGELLWQLPPDYKRIVRFVTDLGRGNMLAYNHSSAGFGHCAHFATKNTLLYELGPVIVAARRLHRTLPLELLENIVQFL